MNLPNLAPLDLEQLAQYFAADIVAWRTNLADVPPVEVVNEPVVADSTPPMIVIPDTNTIKPDSGRSR